MKHLFKVNFYYYFSMTGLYYTPVFKTTDLPFDIIMILLLRKHFSECCHHFYFLQIATEIKHVSPKYSISLHIEHVVSLISYQLKWRTVRRYTFFL